MTEEKKSIIFQLREQNTYQRVGLANHCPDGFSASVTAPSPRHLPSTQGLSPTSPSHLYPARD